MSCGQVVGPPHALSAPASRRSLERRPADAGTEPIPTSAMQLTSGPPERFTPGPTERAREDKQLFARYLATRDPAARDALIARFPPLAPQLARRYQRAEEPLDDLIQVASLGLVKAIDRFDADREVAFSSYAVPTILGEIKRHFRDRTWSVRVPRDLQELSLKVDRTVASMSEELQRSPTVPELSKKLGGSAGEGGAGGGGAGRR